jgi:hydrogenase maturation protease
VRTLSQSSSSERVCGNAVVDSRKERVAVLGLGNILLSDEGVGVHAVNAMKTRYAFSPAVDIIDGGTLGLDLLPLFQDRERILIVDAVDFGREAGAVGVVEGNAIPSVLNTKLSAHHIGVADLLVTTKLTRGTLPEVCLVGIQPGSLDVGLSMTPAVSSQLEGLIDLTVSKLKEWNVAVCALAEQGDP